MGGQKGVARDSGIVIARSVSDMAISKIASPSARNDSYLLMRPVSHICYEG